MGLRALFTHLKIILLQYFQFSTISSIQTDSFIARVEIISIRDYNDFICLYVREKKNERERERERERKLTSPLSRVIYGNYLTKTCIFKLIRVDV